MVNIPPSEDIYRSKCRFRQLTMHKPYVTRVPDSFDAYFHVLSRPSTRPFCVKKSSIVESLIYGSKSARTLSSFVLPFNLILVQNERSNLISTAFKFCTRCALFGQNFLESLDPWIASTTALRQTGCQSFDSSILVIQDVSFRSRYLSSLRCMCLLQRHFFDFVSRYRFIAI